MLAIAWPMVDNTVSNALHNVRALLLDQHAVDQVRALKMQEWATHPIMLRN